MPSVLSFAGVLGRQTVDFDRSLDVGAGREIWLSPLVSRVLAPSYVFESMRAILAKKSFPISGLAWGVGLAAIDVVIACWIFYRVYRHAVRTGLIARYSAETV